MVLIKWGGVGWDVLMWIFFLLAISVQNDFDKRGEASVIFPIFLPFACLFVFYRPGPFASFILPVYFAIMWKLSGVSILILPKRSLPGSKLEFMGCVCVCVFMWECVCVCAHTCVWGQGDFMTPLGREGIINYNGAAAGGLWRGCVCLCMLVCVRSSAY